MDAESLRWLLRSESLGQETIHALIQFKPELRPRLKAVIGKLFREAKPRMRFHELAWLLVFAPDSDAIQEGLEEVRVRPAAAQEYLPIIKANPTCLPVVIDAAFTSIRMYVDSRMQRSLLTNDSVQDANAIYELLQLDPAVFAHSIPFTPQMLIDRLEIMEMLYKKGRNDSFKPRFEELVSITKKPAKKKRKRS